METVQLLPKNKSLKNSPQDYNALPDVHQNRPKLRKLGITPRESAAFTHKRTENEFHIMRKIIEMGEIRKANAKKAQQLDDRNVKPTVLNYRNNANIEKAPKPTECPRPLRRSRSMLKNKPPERFMLSHVKQISIADFKLAQKIQHYVPSCSRMNNDEDLCHSKNSIHCDLFGPGLCPDCQRLEARHEFTKTQNELFPFLDAHPRALVAESKIRSLFNPGFVKSSFQITGRKDIGWNILSNVWTENEIYNRVKRDRRVNVLYC